MFERFSRDARQAVTAAQRAARELGHHRLGTEHLLLGIAAADDAAAATLAAGGTGFACNAASAANGEGPMLEPQDEARSTVDVVLTVNGAEHRLPALDAHTTRRT